MSINARGLIFIQILFFFLNVYKSLQMFISDFNIVLDGTVTRATIVHAQQGKKNAIIFWCEQHSFAHFVFSLLMKVRTEVKQNRLYVC